ncbi:MAG: hypothetical protein HXY34_08260 [Candidatus Thorarchaeota archaeon]|nr:hypothetical protein [Candidatus Thorarchaeota archaeon]
MPLHLSDARPSHPPAWRLGSRWLRKGLPLAKSITLKEEDIVQTYPS